jgi:hypothetical protein
MFFERIMGRRLGFLDFRRWGRLLGPESKKFGEYHAALPAIRPFLLDESAFRAIHDTCSGCAELFPANPLTITIGRISLFLHY